MAINPCVLWRRIIWATKFDTSTSFGDLLSIMALPSMGINPSHKFESVCLRWLFTSGWLGFSGPQCDSGAFSLGHPSCSSRQRIRNPRVSCFPLADFTEVVLKHLLTDSLVAHASFYFL